MFSTTWTVGQQPIFGYVLSRCIGKGTFGEIWIATGPGGLSIALKRVPLAKNAESGVAEMDAFKPVENVLNAHLISIHGSWLIDDLFVIGYVLSDEGLSKTSKATTQLNSDLALGAEATPLFTDASEAINFFCRSVLQSNSQREDANDASAKVIGATPAPVPSTASSSIHEKLKRIRRRPSRPYLRFEPLTSDPAYVTLPFIIGVIGDFTGHSNNKWALAHRKFIQIDRDNLNDVLSAFAPELHLQVVNTLVQGDEPLSVHLRFQSMDDFHPASVAKQVTPLRVLLEKRAKYCELHAIAERAFEPGADRSAAVPPLAVAELLYELFPDGAQWNEDLQKKLSIEIAHFDAVVSAQLAAIMHTWEFQKLEGSWRGLQYLVYNSETSAELRLKVLNITKRELQEDLGASDDRVHSQIYEKIYTSNFEDLGGSPFGAIIADYEFQNHPDDMTMLRNLSTVAAESFCPVIASVGCEMFGFESWSEWNEPRDIVKIFDTPSYASWRSFRESEESRFVVLTMPRSLARLPYGFNTKPIDEFGFEEVPLDMDGAPIAISDRDYCWMSTAYVMGARLTDAFAQFGWCTKIRGVEGGGKVDNLPAHVIRTANGDLEIKCSTEVLIAERRELEISKSGFLPLCHFRETDYAVFFGGQTTQKPKMYEGIGGDDATANAAIVARLPFILATSRFAHNIKVIARDIGPFMERPEFEKWLNNWIMNYVTTSHKSSEEKATHPLADARLEVSEVPGLSDEYNVVAWLRPWLLFEELSHSIRMVIRLPSCAFR